MSDRVKRGAKKGAVGRKSVVKKRVKQAAKAKATSRKPATARKGGEKQVRD